MARHRTFIKVVSFSLSERWSSKRIAVKVLLESKNEKDNLLDAVISGFKLTAGDCLKRKMSGIDIPSSAGDRQTGAH